MKVETIVIFNTLLMTGLKTYILFLGIPTFLALPLCCLGIVLFDEANFPSWHNDSNRTWWFREVSTWYVIRTQCFP